MRSPRLRFLAAAAAPLAFLAVAACSPDSDGADGPSTTSSPDDAAATSAGPSDDLSDVAVEQQDGVPVLNWHGEPLAEGDLPFVTHETQSEQLQAGDGEEVGAEHDVQVRYLAVNGTTGEEIVSTFGTDETVTLDLTDETLLPAFRDNLPGTSEGESVLMALPAEDAFGELGNEQLGVGPEDTLLFYMEILDSYPVAGEPVEPVEGLPTVESDGETPAVIDVDGVEAPDELVVQPLVQGQGAEVEEGQMVFVHYTGVKLSDGEQFDTSYNRGQPFNFQVGSGQVIEGWDQGLIGQNVRSQVLLVIPAEQAYGELPEETDSTTAQPAHELAGEDLVFVVDIIAAY
ncbi:FKBP-type peptidyl-prolyl cis-trans isomerase [Ornithinimicrobium sufpigmenti]|uniref:FKBP-type peptidyl-prolyl cis-trans isomerase n=1 Tax=Ornithinimicrobium sufpigmenti TaxID=2508882 RepID=UPI001036BBB4|nr:MULTISPECIES: FKBP-type peptidyl-prolyl cis-trans isomerase [unclassified Ornithinimicrobium]